MSEKEKTIYLAHPRGVCAGVMRAIQIVENAIREKDTPIFVKHQIVHNKYVIDEFKKKGVVFAETLDEIPKGATVIFSAHGVSPQIIKKADNLGLNYIDATCPIVSAIHKKAVDLMNSGWNIILIGHKLHPEIIGTAGHLCGGAVIIENVNDALNCPIHESAEKITYLTQTTLSPDDVFPITSILKKRYKNLLEPEKNDICYATLERQKAVKNIAHQCELFFIIGSVESSNSKRLKEIVQKICPSAQLINSWKEIEPGSLKNVRTIGLSAGASAPDILLEKTVHFLKTQGFSNIVDFKNRNTNLNENLKGETDAIQGC